MRVEVMSHYFERNNNRRSKIIRAFVTRRSSVKTVRAVNVMPPKIIIVYRVLDERRTRGVAAVRRVASLHWTQGIAPCVAPPRPAAAPQSCA